MRIRISLLVVSLTVVPRILFIDAEPMRAGEEKRNAPRWYKGDLHMHSNYSGDSEVSVADVILASEKAGLDFIALTDHSRVPQQWRDGAYRSQKLTLLFGAEWTVNKGTSGTGHASIWASREIDWSVIQPTLGNYALGDSNSSDIKKAIQLAHSLRTADVEVLVGINHPNGPKWDFPIESSIGADCMEVWNGKWSDGDYQTLAAQYHEFLTRGHRMTINGGSDSHDAQNIGTPTTWVYAQSARGLDIMRGLKKGHTFVSQSADGPELRLYADADERASPGTNNRFETMMGDSIASSTFNREIEFSIDVAAAGFPADKFNASLVTVVKNGRAFKSEKSVAGKYTFTFKDTPRAGDYYRAELRFIKHSPKKSFDEYVNFRNVMAVTGPIFTARE